MFADLVQSSGWPRYRAIVQGVTAAVAMRRILPGDRLPTQRDLADQLGLAVATVGRAYTELESLGVVTSHVGRGTFVSVSHDAESKRSAGETIDLATYRVGVPPVEDALMRTMSALMADHDPSAILGSAPAAGLSRHRTVIADWLRRQGVAAKADGLIVTNGGQHSTMAALSTLTHEGDLIATEDLTDPRMKAIAAYLGRRLVGIPGDVFGLLPDALEHRCRTERLAAIYVTPRCHNPTTITLPFERRVAIAEIARRYDLPIIESDIYGTLLEDPVPPLAALAPERTHAIGGFGRIAGPGMKVGWLVSPERDVVRTQAGVGMSTGAATLLNVELACRWIADGSMELFAQWQKGDNLQRLAVLARYPHLAKADYHPRGAHVWLTLPDPWRAEDFVASAAVHGISIAPTHSFVVGRTSIPHSVRLCIGAAADLASLETACDRLERLLGTSPRIGMEAA